jgi:3-hydroxyacyl-[acyl-carrier-protein] dehydratase
MKPDEILARLPHSFPFRMIDRILEIEPGKRAVTLKNVSVDEPFLRGHYPKEPVVPVVFILEAMAQTGGIAFHSLSQADESAVPYLAGVEEFRSKKKVVPGDRMILTAEIQRIFSHLAKVKVVARVEDEPVAEGMLVLAKGPPTDK